MELGFKNKFLNKYIIYSIAVLILFFAVFMVFGKEGNIAENFKFLTIGDVQLKVEIADTPFKRAQGLSGRNFLAMNEGMVFIYGREDNFAFWMKGMNFPLDFIWIREGKVVEITQDVQVADYQPPKNFKPIEKADMILEVNAGFVHKNGIKVGDGVILK